MPVHVDIADALLTIQQGEPGPRGGTSNVDVSHYLIQYIQPDPETDPAGWEFLLFNLGNRELYQTFIPFYRAVGHCTCRGFGEHTLQTCKHHDALEHVCRVLGWENVTHRGNDHESGNSRPELTDDPHPTELDVIGSS